MDAEKRGRAFTDTRVHCLLYFISPYGRGLKPLDLEVLKKLDGKVNLIPVIAKEKIYSKLSQLRCNLLPQSSHTFNFIQN